MFEDRARVGERVEGEEREWMEMEGGEETEEGGRLLPRETDEWVEG